MSDELATARVAKAKATTALAELDAAYAPVAELVQELEAEGWHDRLPASVDLLLTNALSAAENFIETYRDLRESYHAATADIPSPAEAAEFTATVEEYAEQMGVATASAQEAAALLTGLHSQISSLLADTDPPRAAALAKLAALESAAGRLAEHGLDTSAFDEALDSMAGDAEILRSGRFPETAEGQTLRQATVAMIERFDTVVGGLLAEATALVESADQLAAALGGDDDAEGSYADGDHADGEADGNGGAQGDAVGSTTSPASLSSVAPASSLTASPPAPSPSVSTQTPAAAAGPGPKPLIKQSIWLHIVLLLFTFGVGNIVYFLVVTRLNKGRQSGHDMAP